MIKNYLTYIKENKEENNLIVYEGGTKVWLKNGKRHRLDGPAVEYLDGTKKWFINGKLHRDDGPAVEYSNGIKSWYKDGKGLGVQDLENLPENHPLKKAYIKWKYGII